MLERRDEPMDSFAEDNIKNEVFADMDYPSPVIYEQPIQYLKCGKCRRRRIPEEADDCPNCGSWDLIPDLIETESRYQTKGFE